MVALLFVASSECIDLLQEAAADQEGVDLGPVRSVDASGDAMHFPLDPDIAIEVVKVVAAIVGSVNGTRALLGAWKERKERRARAEPPTAEVAQSTAVVVSVPSTGEVIYQGPLEDLDTEIAVGRIALTLGEHE